MDGPIELNKVNHPVFTEKWEINCFCNIFVIRKNDFNRLLKVCRIWTFSFSNLCKSHCLFTEYRHLNQFCVWKNEGFWWNFVAQTQQFVHLFFQGHQIHVNFLNTVSVDESKFFSRKSCDQCTLSKQNLEERIMFNLEYFQHFVLTDNAWRSTLKSRPTCTRSSI